METELLALILNKMERWQSGRMRSLGKRVRVNPLRGFESLSLRHNFLNGEIMMEWFNVHPYMVIMSILIFILIMIFINFRSIINTRDKLINRMDHIEDRIIERLASESLQKNLSDEYREYVNETKENTSNKVGISAYEKFTKSKESRIKERNKD